MSAIWVKVSSAWKRRGRPDLTPEPPAGGFGGTPFGSSTFGG